MTNTPRNTLGSVSPCILQTSQGRTELLVPFHDPSVKGFLTVVNHPTAADVGSHGAGLLVDA